MSSLSSQVPVSRAPASKPGASAPGPIQPAWPPLRRALALASLASTAWLAGCGGGGASVATSPGDNPGALSTARNGEVLAYVKSKLKARGPQGQVVFEGDLAWLSTTATSGGTVTSNGTVVQEAGVDEDDLIKTDGTRILTLEPRTDGSATAPFARLAVHERGSDGRTQELGGAALTASSQWAYTRGMLFAPQAQRVAVLAEGAAESIGLPVCPVDMLCIAALLPYRPTQPLVELQVLDVSQPKQIATPLRMSFDGRLIGTRQVGSVLVVVASHAPVLAFDQLATTSTEAERQAALDRMTVTEVMPRISVNGGPREPMVNETDCWLQPANANTQVAVTTITTIDLASSALTRRTRCFVGGSEAMYLSTASLYLATARTGYQTLAGRTSFAPESATDVHKFALSGAEVGYRGSGIVNGHLGWDRSRASYRMSEHNGDLRVLSFTGSVGWVTLQDAAAVAASPATLTVLREGSSGSLQTVATLPNSRRPAAIGKAGEQVYGVRFAGDRGYVVTFRQTDPLYVLDLADPADPKMAGALEVPGFSDWLFPLDGGLLFGVGREADSTGRTGGVKVALFDVRDAAAPKVLDSRTFGARGSGTALDGTPHGLGLRTVGNVTRLALPMLLTASDWVSPSQKLQRFEVDTAARSLTVKPTIEQGEGWVDLTTARSLLLGEQLHYLRAGKLVTYDW